MLAGINGTNGADGLSVLSGSGVPSNLLGADTQYYIDKVAPFNMYLKTAGVWNFLGKLQGIDGNGFFIQYNRTLTSSEIHLSTTPVVLLPTLNNSQAYCVESVVLTNKFNTTPWTITGGNYFFRYTTNTTTITTAVAGSILTLSSTRLAKPQLTSTTPSLGSSVELVYLGGTPSAGDGTLNIQLVYYIITI